MSVSASHLRAVVRSCTSSRITAVAHTQVGRNRDEYTDLYLRDVLHYCRIVRRRCYCCCRCTSCCELQFVIFMLLLLWRLMHGGGCRAVD